MKGSLRDPLDASKPAGSPDIKSGDMSHAVSQMCMCVTPATQVSAHEQQALCVWAAPVRDEETPQSKKLCSQKRENDQRVLDTNRFAKALD